MTQGMTVSEVMKNEEMFEMFSELDVKAHEEEAKEHWAKH